MNLQMILLLIAKIVEPPIQGVSKRDGRAYARVTVAGAIGDNFERISLGLPEGFDVRKLRMHETWIWPLAKIEGDDKRRVFYKLRSDPEGLKLLQRVPDDWVPIVDDETA